MILAAYSGMLLQSRGSNWLDTPSATMQKPSLPGGCHVNHLLLQTILDMTLKTMNIAIKKRNHKKELTIRKMNANKSSSKIIFQSFKFSADGTHPKGGGGETTKTPKQENKNKYKKQTKKQKNKNKKKEKKRTKNPTKTNNKNPTNKQTNNKTKRRLGYAKKKKKEKKKRKRDR